MFSLFSTPGGPQLISEIEKSRNVSKNKFIVPVQSRRQSRGSKKLLHVGGRIQKQSVSRGRVLAFHLICVFFCYEGGS